MNVLKTHISSFPLPPFCCNFFTQGSPLLCPSHSLLVPTSGETFWFSQLHPCILSQPSLHSAWEFHSFFLISWTSFWCLNSFRSSLLIHADLLPHLLTFLHIWIEGFHFLRKFNKLSCALVSSAPHWILPRRSQNKPKSVLQMSRVWL